MTRQEWIYKIAATGRVSASDVTAVFAAIREAGCQVIPTKSITSVWNANAIRTLRLSSDATSEAIYALSAADLTRTEP